MWLRVDRVARKKEVIERDWLRQDPVCSDLPILSQPAGTNWILDEAHRERLERLWSRTAVDWDRADCVAALWAYDVTYPGPISKLRGSPVASVAQQIGRAVGGVYNKLLNFRHIDPRDTRAGLSGGSIVDQEVWDEFWDAGAGQLRSEALEQAYVELWGAPPSAGGTAKPPQGTPPGRPAPPPSAPAPLPPPPPPGLAPGRGTSTVSRIVRDTRVAAWVKQAHDYTCQVCGIRLVGRDGPYAEGAHIQPLGAEHRGPDRVENVLCLCANHHVLIDMGAYAILDDGSLVDLLGAGVGGRLRIVPEHAVGKEYLDYHRSVVAKRPA